MCMAINSVVFAQFTSGVVSLPTAAMTVKIETNPTIVTLTLTGDSSSMLGLGFGNSGMASGSDGFIFNSTANRDYTFAGVGVSPSPDVTQDWTITTNTISGSTRTIVATRSLSGGSGDFAIANSSGTIDVFYAKRDGNLTLGYHGNNRDYATLTMSASMAVDDVNNKKSLLIYPNPVKDEINFKNVENIRSISILDSSGKIIYSSTSVKEKMDIAKLKPGTYFVEIIDKQGNINYQKIIKN